MYNTQNPYYTGTPYTAPQLINTPQSSTSFQITGPQLIKVNGLDSAKAYPTVANSTIALFDANDDIMYIKSTDASNFPTIRRFRFVEETEPANEDTEKYVTVEEFNKFKEELLNGKQSVWSSATIDPDTKQSSKYKRVDGYSKNQKPSRDDGNS